ncbi:MAG TPA: DNA adenine methylase [Verrucomicrobiae bacterium]|nr:DNA adenine methylase [Verrucomicrobiae bacterium]
MEESHKATDRLRSPLNYFGSKSRIASRIVKHFPNHHTFVDVFGGSAAVLLAKPPSAVEVYNDIDGDLVNFFRVLQDPDSYAKLCWALSHTLHSRAEFELAKQKTDDPVEAARRFMVRQRQSFGGKGYEWSYSVQKSIGGIASVARRWQQGVEVLPAAKTRFHGVQIEQADWREVMLRYDTPNTLFFCDPPYHPEVRVSGKYRHEFTARDHEQFVAFLPIIRGMVVLSGYQTDAYKALEHAGWKRKDFVLRTHSSDFRSRRVESLWLSPACARGAESRKLFLSPIERMVEGARQTHEFRVTSTTQRIVKAIRKLNAAGRQPTMAAIARAVKMSPEHLCRRYRHLFVN